ncbi:MAG: TonB-dependent receptor, partial [Bacteroidota bacterium]
MAQNGIIRGQVIDDGTGETLIGATVLVDGTSTGSTTDLDGKFSISVAPGTYRLRVSFISYENKVIENVTVQAEEVTALGIIRLPTETSALEEVVIESKALRDSESALLTVQKNAANVLDGLSAEGFTRTGDNDAGAAMRRITGVSVEGGKYVYVRGLGDRYTKTSLNGADVPGLDPNRNTVQMDLFPTKLVDNIIVYKTFTPDLAGDFTGGFVDVTTKDFPEEFIFEASANVGFNPQANFQDDFLTYRGGDLDWLGFDDGTRDFPGIISQVEVPDNQIVDPGLTEDVTRAFDNNYEFQREAQFLNHRFSLSAGNQKSLFKRPFGFIASLNYQRNFQSYTDGETGRYTLTSREDLVEDLNEELRLVDQYSQDIILWGVMANGSLKISDKHKLSLNILRNQSSEKNTRFQSGVFPREDATLNYETRQLQFLERALTSFQLKGEHVFGEDNKVVLDWTSSYILSTQDEPDLRFYTNGFSPTSNGEIIYVLEPSTGQVPSRYTRNLEEFNFDNKLNLTIKFKQWNDLESKFKVGGAAIFKDREFREDQYRVNSAQGRVNWEEDLGPYYYVSEAFEFDAENNPNGAFVNRFFEPRNNYDATQSVLAGYAMVDMPVTAKLRAIVGARLEQTDIEIESFDNQQGDLETLDLLPSVNLTYSLQEDMNLRAAYGRTLARPTFRELAPFASFDFIGDFIFIGNPDLERTLIDNFDLRWEVFPSFDELISASVFYKTLQNPIERVTNPTAANPEINMRNVDEAIVYGFEVEVRKNLGFIAKPLFPFSIGANFSLIRSQIDINPLELQSIRATVPTADEQRVMFGQSPYIVNAYLSFRNEKGTQASINFNVQGERLALVTDGGTPDIFEQPRPMLDLMA